MYMKKYFAQGALAVAVLIGAAFMACDDEDHTSTSGTTFTRMEMEFAYEVNDDLLAVADITFSYTDPEGVTTTVADPMTDKKWSKLFSTTSLPSGFTVEVKVAMKSGIKLDKDSYTLVYSWTDTFREYRSDDNVHWHDGPDKEDESVTITANPADPSALEAQVQSALNLMNRVYRYTVAPDPDGSGYEVTDND